MTRKEQIVQKALELFAHHGYENTTIQKLADACGVAQGLLYRHFKNKEALLAHLVQLGLAEISNTVAPYTISDLSFKEAFKEHIRLCCKQLQTNPLLWKILHSVRQNAVLMEAVGLNGNIADIAKPLEQKLRQDNYQEPHTTALLIVALIDGITAMHLLDPDAYPLEIVQNFLLQKIDKYE